MRIPPPERLTRILERELDARNVYVVSDDEPAEMAPHIAWDLGHARTLVVIFSRHPTDLQEKHDRLAALSESFADLFADAARALPRTRPEPKSSLQTELNALAGRARASTVVIIDAKSPIIWGASEAPSNTDDTPVDPPIHDAFVRAKEIGISWHDVLARPPGAPVPERRPSKAAPETARILRLVPPIDEWAGLTPSDRDILAPRTELARHAITRVRSHAVLPQLHRGEHLHEAVVEDSFAYIARSFATIYVLILVFPGPFDELGAERAVNRSLPIIERLVVSLPPDDTPETRTGAVVALRPRRR